MKEETVVFIVDSHVTHTENLAATDMAREAGVVMVSLHHTRLTDSSLWTGLFRSVREILR